MKKQIALLATIIAASGFTAFGQGYMSFGTSTAKYISDEGVSPIAFDDNEDVIILYSATDASDPLDGFSNTGANTGAGGGVATNGVTSVVSASPEATIASMLAGGNWSTIDPDGLTGSNNAVVATMSGSGKNVGIISYEGGSIFQANAGSASTDESVEMIMIAYNSSASSFLTASDIGWSSPFTYTLGSTASDPSAGTLENASGLNPFGVAPVPEPATLVLAGLGGLSMLAFRRRKA